uniref:Uncharacterized protein n=1 Tax=Arundo donax TaxID=35708 RepID=A0A0A9E041_ARUDO
MSGEPFQISVLSLLHIFCCIVHLSKQSALFEFVSTFIFSNRNQYTLKRLKCVTVHILRRGFCCFFFLVICIRHSLEVLLLLNPLSLQIYFAHL